jgi:cyclic pyranopterin phosphate synthase
MLYTCLFASMGTSLRDAIRSGEHLGDLLGKVWGAREDRYSEIRSSMTDRLSTPIEMSYIGG